jgi:hypothetical protein
MDPDPDPTPLFIDFKNAKKNFLLITCPRTSSESLKKFNFLLNFCAKILFCGHYFNTFMRKGKEPEPDPYL